MSGIVGIMHLDGHPVSESLLEQMTTTLAHRGPDASGVWYENSVGLGNVLLKTTPESDFETMPLVYQASNLILTADARIDNRSELLRQLDFEGRSATQIPDSEFIAAAYLKWGNRCPEFLIGDYVFAVWDKRTQTLFCARDHFGVRPFYYYRTNSLFLFASEIKALFCLPEIPRRLNEWRVAEYLTESFDDKAITFYEDILRLPPAHFMEISREAVKQTQYWSLDPDREIKLESDEAYAEAYREIFTEAVRCRLRSPVPKIGSFLSGGLDSSSIVCTARDLLADTDQFQLHTFSSIFTDVKKSDERPYIDAVISQGGLTAHFIRGDKLSPLGDLERVMWHQDEAFYAFNLFIIWELCRRASQEGVRVLLDGLLGDSTVYNSHHYIWQLAYSGRWLKMTRELKYLSDRYDDNLARMVLRNIWNNAVLPRTPTSVRRLSSKLTGKKSTSKNRGSILNPSFIKHLQKRHRIPSNPKFRPIPGSIARWKHYQELTSGILPFGMEICSKLAPAFSVEIRYPFSDRRLMEFCLGLPAEQKLQKGWYRSIARRGLTNLPDKIRWRPDKGNLGYNFKQSLVSYEENRLNDVLLQNNEVLKPFVNFGQIKTSYQSLLDNTQEIDGEALNTVWLSATLALWLKDTKLEDINRETI